MKNYKHAGRPHATDAEHARRRINSLSAGPHLSKIISEIMLDHDTSTLAPDGAASRSSSAFFRKQTTTGLKAR